jgi:hypothetical protein
MVHDAQNYWVSKLCPSSGILKTKKHDVSETASVFVLRPGEGDTSSVGSLKKSLLQLLGSPRHITTAI